MMDFRALVLKLGHVGACITVGAISVVASVVMTLLAMALLDIPFEWTSFSLSIIIPAIVAPSVSWYFFKLYFRLEAMETQMRTLATYDALTGLLTRKEFMERGEKMIHRAKRLHQSITFLYLDLDNFKQINDRYGHEGGDKVLMSVGEILLQGFRSGDIVGRLGGEEIGIMLIGMELEGVIKIIERIQYAFRHTKVTTIKEEISFTSSIGVYVMDGKDVTIDHALSCADHALYKAKQHGKDCTYLYEGEGTYRKLGTQKVH